jgi:hypothetical protein
MDKSQIISDLTDEISNLEEHLYELQKDGEQLAAWLEARENLLKNLETHKGPIDVQEPFRPGQA